MQNEGWEICWKTDVRFRIRFVMTILILLTIAVSINFFFLFIEERKGYEFPDPLLNSFSPYALSIYTFLLIYSAIVFTLLSLINKPRILLNALQALAILMIVRMLVLYFVALEAPKTMIPLQDPFIEKFFYGQTRITKDLFFSGHVSILCLTIFYIPRYKMLMLFITAVVAVLILLQHVHYSIDVLAAPFFSWVSYKIVAKTNL
jgi:hypothetical protein